jgi:hypothetical protein
MPQKITYYAIVNEFSSRDKPGGVLRRVDDDEGQSDEVFTRELIWERSPLLYSAERGDTQNDLIPINEDEASRFQRWSGLSLQVHCHRGGTRVRRRVPDAEAQTGVGVHELVGEVRVRGCGAARNPLLGCTAGAGLLLHGRSGRRAGVPDSQAQSVAVADLVVAGGQRGRRPG